MKKEESSLTTNIDNTHVPDKVYAFMIQSHHMLYELVNCKKGDSVSVEVFDDVGVEHEDGSKDSIQLKSALSNRNPVSNKAVDLWKTMYNWMLSVENGDLKIDNVKFVLFINVDKKDSIVEKFNLSKNHTEAVEAWNYARKFFYDETDKLKAIGKEYKQYVEYFFEYSKKELAYKIIQSFELKKCIDNYSVTVRKEFEKTGIPKDIIDPIYMGIIGWIDVNVTKMAEERRSIVISFDNYEAQLHTLYREHNQRYSLMTHSIEPTDQEVQSELKRQRMYIKQLDIIDCDYTEKVRAINDYLRASIDRTIWAQNNDVSYQNMQSYENRLKRAWDLSRKIVMLEKKEYLPEEQGKLIYYRCLEKEIKMDSVCVPDFFQSGCYHSLSDELEVGWHPKYIEKLNEGKE